MHSRYAVFAVTCIAVAVVAGAIMAKPISLGRAEMAAVKGATCRQLAHKPNGNACVEPGDPCDKRLSGAVCTATPGYDSCTAVVQYTNELGTNLPCGDWSTPTCGAAGSFTVNTYTCALYSDPDLGVAVCANALPANAVACPRGSLLLWTSCGGGG
jgi:hypothetical protein